jgi:hypothetical protein
MKIETIGVLLRSRDHGLTSYGVPGLLMIHQSRAAFALGLMVAHSLDDGCF